ncbi:MULTISPECIES: hypothetical protein [unclassified Rhizobium]
MKTTRHAMRLLVDVTAHGWGHLSQTTPVIAALRRRIADLQCVTRSALPVEILAERLGPVNHHIVADTDFGMVMRSPFSVDRAATLEKYKALHRNFEVEVDVLSALIHKTRCDAVFSNVGYVALAAAKRAGVPAIACSSLNWSDMFRFFCGGMGFADEIQMQMDNAYAAADLFLRLAPGMPMEHFRTRLVAKPIASTGRSRRRELDSLVGPLNGRGVVLCAFGGMLPHTKPRFDAILRDYLIIGPKAWSGHGVISPEQVDMPYEDIFASVDLVITKPGYGVVAELGCLGKSSIMISRGDWPEQVHLLKWLSKCAVVESLEDISALDAIAIDRVKNTARQISPPALPGGEEEVADKIMSLLQVRRSGR